MATTATDTTPLVVRVPRPLLDQVRDAAKAEDRTLAQFVRQALREALARKAV